MYTRENSEFNYIFFFSVSEYFLGLLLGPFLPLTVCVLCARSKRLVAVMQSEGHAFVAHVCSLPLCVRGSASMQAKFQLDMLFRSLSSLLKVCECMRLPSILFFLLLTKYVLFVVDVVRRTRLNIIYQALPSLAMICITFSKQKRKEENEKEHSDDSYADRWRLCAAGE